MSVFTPIDALLVNLQRNETVGAVRIDNPTWKKLQHLCDEAGIREHAALIAPWVDLVDTQRVSASGNTQMLAFPPLIDPGFRAFLSGLSEDVLSALFGLDAAETHGARSDFYMNAPCALRLAPDVLADGDPPSVLGLLVRKTFVCERKPLALTRCVLSGTYTGHPQHIISALEGRTGKTFVAIAPDTRSHSLFRTKIAVCTYSNKVFFRPNFTFSRVRFRDGSESSNACLELLHAEGVEYTPIAPVIPFELPGYHGPVRVWNSSSNEAKRTAHHYGVELELGFESREARDALFHKLFDTNGSSKDGIALVERDGSLRDVPNGCEIVAAPLRLSDYQDPNGWWQRHLAMFRAATGKGWPYRHTAGIHVNMNAAKIPRDVLNKTALFITVAFPLSVRIAGRKNIYNPTTTIDPATDARYGRLRARLQGTGYWGINTTEYADAFLEMCGSNKYSVMSLVHSKRAEVRIFGSNIDTVGFVSCVEYCDAVMAFVKDWTPDGIVSRGVRLALDFRKFVFDHESKWPYLCKRMRASAFAKECQ